jgi:hypothetical protein
MSFFENEDYGYYDDWVDLDIDQVDLDIDWDIDDETYSYWDEAYSYLRRANSFWIGSGDEDPEDADDDRDFEEPWD